MSREWKPGDVAMLTHLDGSVRRSMLHPDGKWHCADGGLGHTPDDDMLRPLVVIDPEDREQVEALCRAHHGVVSDQNIHDMQHALRSLITPPEPDQPGNIGAVIEARWSSTEDKRGYVAQWCQAGDGSWVCLTDGRTGTSTAWPFFSEIKILSPGVTQ